MINDNKSALDWALKLADKGFFIFPLRPGTKEPYLGRSWTQDMTNNSEEIRQWFEEMPDINYGVCPGSKHVIVDLDVKESANGLEAFKEMQQDQDVLDWVFNETFTVKSPSGGYHLYLATDTPASNAHRFPKGVDIRGAHGYVVGPGCSLVGGQCDPKDTPGSYVTEVDSDFLFAPDWIKTKLRRQTDEDSKNHDPMFDLDDDDSVARAREFLKHRDPAIEGLGGDHHTLITAMCLIDFGISEAKVLELLTEPFLKTGESEAQSWNDRCLPAWDVHGRHGTLEEKVRNAWKYREREPGTKGGGAAFDEDYLKEIVDISTLNATESAEKRFARIQDHLFKGGKIFSRGRRREFVIPEWLPAHGMVASLARRGGGKTVVMVDMALRIASDMEWHGYPIKEGFTAVYICGEDDEGAEEQVRAWCKTYGRDAPPDRFLFLDIITDLMSADDTREWAEALKHEIGANGRAVVFLDTWQRASAKGGQNKDEDMQIAVHHAEALAKSLNGPAVVAFHPPKHDDRVVMGSTVIENSTTAIWSMSDHTSGKKLEVTRIKGKGVGNYQLFNFKEVTLGEKDDFGKERTGLVPVRLGGVDSEGKMDLDEGDETSKKAFANVMREIELRRKDDDPESTKHYAVTHIAKIISEELPEKEAVGDEWAEGLLNELRDAGTINTNSWRRVSDRIIELFGDDPRGYDFGDGYALRVYKDSNSKRVRIEKSSGKKEE